MAEPRCDLPTPGGPNSRMLSPFPTQLSAAVMALTCALDRWAPWTAWERQ